MRALLAFLLLHANELVSADRLIDEVWGPEPPKTAGASLQNYVSRLRKAIGAETIVSQPPGYVLRVDPEQFDAARFERLSAEARRAEPRERAEKLRAALALWRGPALDDLAFEPFARDDAGRLEESRLAALEDCIDAELELGHDGLVGELEELVEEHPLRERFRAQLMRALYRAGRQADALAAFRSARDVLTEELGLEPGEELRALQQAILRQDPSLGPATPAARERVPDRRTVTVLRCGLVGSSELAAQLDPEAYRARVSQYFELVRESIERHDGTVETFIDDTVAAVFGVPELHEDDALRAVRAAVEAQAGLRRADLAVRIGVATGEVHVHLSPAEPLHVSGAPAGAAARLEARGPAGEVLLSRDTHALVRDAVRAEAVDDGWLVRAVIPGAPAFARRLDAPLVNRAEELERLHTAYGDACTGTARVVTVVGEAGIGKTRLLQELVKSARDEARILVGRCVSYGEGATYLPIAEAVRQAAPSADAIAALLEREHDGEQVARRIAELTGLAEEPAVPGEALWAVRRFVETLARERPLVLVLDDIHWAEPTLLDLVEYLGQWAEASVLVLCAARGELLETRPSWGGPTSTGFIVDLDPLAAGEMEQLVVGLSEEPVDPDVERRVVEQAGGNPLFAEQLLALASESPAGMTDTPPSVEALIATRLDRLDRRELAVLRRASVVGRRFTKTALDDLTPPDEISRNANDLGALAARALIHPREELFVFHHVLVRDVAYRGLPKSERAELHELAATALDRRDEPDEIVGYHFEQAHRYLDELSLDDEHARALAHAAGARLGRAGIRAWQRGDVHAATGLLRRSVALRPDAHSHACELALALHVQGADEEAAEVLQSVLDRAEGYEKVRAELEYALLRALREPNAADALLAIATRAVPLFEQVGDDRALGRAWYCVAFVRGAFLCQYAAMEQAADEIEACYRRSGWPLSAAVDMLGVALVFGPKPVDAGIARLADLSGADVGDRWTETNISIALGQLEAMRGNFDAARVNVARARAIFDELGAVAAVTAYGRAAAAIERAAGFPAAAEEPLRAACAQLQATGQTSVLATWAAELAGALYEQGQFEEASEWVDTARANAGDDDLDAHLARRPVEARLHLVHGRLDMAEQVARAGVELAASTDALNHHADALVALAQVLERRGSEVEAAGLVDEALDLYDRKGNTVAAARLREARGEPRAGLSGADL
jgi:DNA-binding SARP family transcriptional activator/tetratricopeptide (TPR) repeat protein